ncbi:MAG: glycosyltransferase family 39 protein [Smithellaceae bacterium]|nr:glycosyltransferase family 39 protein [Smithellaceae bacterium]
MIGRPSPSPSPPGPFHRISRWDILLVALILIGSFTFRYLHHSQPINRIGGDQQVYNQLAVNLLMGHGFSQSPVPPYRPSIVRTPGYPAFLALIYMVFGIEHFEAVRIAQILLMSLSALILFAMAFLISNNKLVALLSLLFFSFYGFNYYSGLGVYSYLFTESLVIFIINASILLLIVSMRQHSITLSFTLGIVLALAMLTRPSNLLLPLVIALFILWVRFSRQTITSVIFMLLAIVIVVSPWTIRNHLQFGKFIPLSMSLKGLFIYGGLANPVSGMPESKASTNAVIILPEQRKKADAAIAGLYGHFLYGGAGGVGIAKHDDVLSEIGLDLLSKNKGVFMQRWLYRTLEHWSVGELARLFDPNTAISRGGLSRIAVIVALIFLIALAVVKHYRNPSFLALLLFPIYNTLMYTPLASEYRYSLPSRGFMMIVISIGLFEGIRLIFNRYRSVGLMKKVDRAESAI